MRRAHRPLHMAAALCLLLVLLMIGGAAADESLQVSIPVTALGHGCTAELYEISSGRRVQVLNLQEGIENAFQVHCTGMKRFTYNALVADEDTEDVAYDRRNFRVTVDVMYGADGRLTAMVTIENLVAPDGKNGRIEFVNTPSATPSPSPSATPTATPTPTPAPTVSPTPTLEPEPTPTPELYEFSFTFTKIWKDGRENSIDWVMYNPDGTPRRKGFNRKIISDDEWRYEAWFPESVDGCYVVEIPPTGYAVYYQNTGEYSDVTDRCYSGGTIINQKIPETGDDTANAIAIALAVASMMGLYLMAKRSRRDGEEA